MTGISQINEMTIFSIHELLKEIGEEIDKIPQYMIESGAKITDEELDDALKQTLDELKDIKAYWYYHPEDEEAVNE